MSAGVGREILIMLTFDEVNSRLGCQFNHDEYGGRFFRCVGIDAVQGFGNDQPHVRRRVLQRLGEDRRD